MFKKPNRPIDTVWIHCSAASRKSVTVDEVRQWHLDRGWSDIGYHYFIDSDGVLHEGRSLEKAGAHVRGHNKRSIGICLNGLHVGDFTEKQFDTLRKLCDEIDNAYGGMRFRGHNEVAAKACPVFDYRAVLNLSKKGYIKDEQEIEGKAPPTPVDKPVVDVKTVSAVAVPAVSGIATALSGASTFVQVALLAPISLGLCVGVAYVAYRLWQKAKT